MTNTHADENKRRPVVRPVAKLFRLASLVVAAALGGSLDAPARAQTTGAKQPAQAPQPQQTQTQRPQQAQPQQPQQSQQPQPAQPKAPAKPGQPAGVPAPAADASTAQKYFTDVELINQHGERVRLYSDVLKNRVVVVNAFFATCQGSCLPMNRNLEKLQAAFKERMGKDLYIISISVDPTVDTPQALKEYAKKLNAAPGRLFLTGKKENVDWALYKLGQYVEQREQHTNIFIIGNERTGLWKKAFGLAQADELVKIVESVLNDTPTPSGGK